ncbi:hypothetical protein P154DRAFT_579064 [Amniculicola lignicola CBS 123094]|uniref:Uncharacterized protein n=1 Tax=Amniculicola lignicola CBS 123094 TaxID=1392246 RepID=A0A6A5WI32_9PLEO|nr:hypothetical protein P154DRAFT_579064 [Amniculicola lignicola CBS 123094]
MRLAERTSRPTVPAERPSPALHLPTLFSTVAPSLLSLLSLLPLPHSALSTRRCCCVLDWLLSRLPILPTPIHRLHCLATCTPTASARGTHTLDTQPYCLLITPHLLPVSASRHSLNGKPLQTTFSASRALDHDRSPQALCGPLIAVPEPAPHNVPAVPPANTDARTQQQIRGWRKIKDPATA